MLNVLSFLQTCISPGSHCIIIQEFAFYACFIYKFAKKKREFSFLKWSPLKFSKKVYHNQHAFSIIIFSSFYLFRRIPRRFFFWENFRTLFREKRSRQRTVLPKESGRAVSFFATQFWFCRPYTAEGLSECLRFRLRSGCSPGMQSACAEAQPPCYSVCGRNICRLCL